MLREFLKNKDKRHKREIDKKMFSRKLGGTHNNENNLHKKKTGKPSKNMNLINKFKFRGKKSIKSKKTK